MQIPKILHLTCKSKDPSTWDTKWKKCYQQIQEFYKDYEICIYDDQDIYNLVEEHFPDHLEEVKNVNCGAALADIFRYLIMYLKGGIYSDMDCMPLKKIDSLLLPSTTYFHGNEDDDDKFLIYPIEKRILDSSSTYHRNPCDNCIHIEVIETPFSRANIQQPIQQYQCLGHQFVSEDTVALLGREFSLDYDHKGYIGRVSQWFMISKPKLNVFKQAYLGSIENITHRVDNIIEATGPTLFTKIIKEVEEPNVVILPCDSFCAGSGCSVNISRNSYIKHQFTETWENQKLYKNK